MALPRRRALRGRGARSSNIAPPATLPDAADPAARRRRWSGSASGRDWSANSRRIAEVSDAVIRGLVKAGAIEAVDGRCDAPYPEPDPDVAPPDARSDEQTGRGADLRDAVGRGAGFEPFLLDGVTGSGKTEVYFEAIAAGDPRGQAGAGPAPRNRADRAVPQALRRALRLRAGRLAFGPAPIAAPPRLARDRQRRGEGRRRRPLGAVPALSPTSA